MTSLLHSHVFNVGAREYIFEIRVYCWDFSIPLRLECTVEIRVTIEIRVYVVLTLEYTAEFQYNVAD